jgi:hypothetical protein
LLLLLILYSAIFAQNNSESIGLVKENNTLSQINPTELIYLQTSKGIYEAGEDLLFKAYLLNVNFISPITTKHTA